MAVPQILSPNCPGLIAAYDMSYKGVSKGVLVNQAKPSNANNGNPGQYSVRPMYGRLNVTNKGTHIKEIKSLLQTYRAITQITDTRTYNIAFYLKGAARNYKTLMFDASPAGTHLLINVSGNIGYYDFSGGGITTVFSVSTILSYTTLNTVTLIIDSVNNKVTLYCNGKYISTGNKKIGSSMDLYCIGNNDLVNGWYSDCIFVNLMGYNRILSNYEIKAYHSFFANKTILLEKYDYPVGTIKGNINNWKKVSGTWSIEEQTTPNILPKGKKYLKCTVAGIMYLPTINSRYGTITTKVLKAANVNILDFILSCSVHTNIVAGNTGYLLRYDSDEKFKLYAFNGTSLTQIGSSSTLTYAFGVWQKVKVEASTNNTWRVWVNGSVVITGSNSTYTTGKYISLDFDANDSITDLQVKAGVMS